jgi:hypothetical protein
VAKDPRTRKKHSEDSSFGANLMWSRVADRTERLRNAINAGPAGYNWHAKRLFGADVDLDALTPRQWKQVEDARLAYLRAMALKATQKRRLLRAARLREEAAAIEAEVGEP